MFEKNNQEENEVDEDITPQIRGKKTDKWSGLDVMDKMNTSRARFIFERLSSIVVFRYGWKGFLDKIVHALKKFTEHFLFEYTMTACVILNTIALAFDRYNIPDS